MLRSYKSFHLQKESASYIPLEESTPFSDYLEAFISDETITESEAKLKLQMDLEECFHKHGIEVTAISIEIARTLSQRKIFDIFANVLVKKGVQHFLLKLSSYKKDRIFFLNTDVYTDIEKICDNVREHDYYRSQPIIRLSDVIKLVNEKVKESAAVELNVDTPFADYFSWILTQPAEKIFRTKHDGQPIEADMSALFNSVGLEVSYIQIIRHDSVCYSIVVFKFKDKEYYISYDSNDKGAGLYDVTGIPKNRYGVTDFKKLAVGSDREFKSLKEILLKLKTL
jgi:hypothetical protein